MHSEAAYRTTWITLPLVLIIMGGCGRSIPAGSPDRHQKSRTNTSEVAKSETVCDFSEPLNVEVTGSDYLWFIRYPGCDGKLHSADDIVVQRNIHVPLGIQTRIHLKSRDFLYQFDLPDFDIREIAVPEIDFSMDLLPQEKGKFPLDGNEMCGRPHPKLKGWFVVESLSDFSHFLQTVPKPTEATRSRSK